jgi:hypothetical protein
MPDTGDTTPYYLQPNAWGTVTIDETMAMRPEPKRKIKPELKEGTVRSELSHYHKFKDYKGTFGIEIETETADSVAYPPDFFVQIPHDEHVRYKVPMTDWEGHVDNSLRNFGMEYVLKVPLSYEESIVALDDFAFQTTEIHFLKNTPSTSVHVHVNFLEESFLTLANFLTLYTLFENVLVDFSGPTRRSNLFALPIRVAERTEGNIVKLLEKVSKGNWNLGLSANHMKYAALNIATLTQIGSLEIRSFRGTTDVSEIKEWLGIINRLLVYSKTDGMTPVDILQAYRDRDMEFFQEVFREFSKPMVEKVLDIGLLIERNLWYTMRIARSVPDWSVVNTAISSKLREEKSPPRAKKLVSFVAPMNLSATQLTAYAAQYSDPQPTIGVIDDESDED